MKLRLLILAAITQLHTCAALDNANWSVNTSYNPATKEVKFGLGKEPLPK